MPSKKVVYRYWNCIPFSLCFNSRRLRSKNAVLKKRSIYLKSLYKDTNDRCSRAYEIVEPIRNAVGGLSVFAGLNG